MIGLPVYQTATIPAATPALAGAAGVRRLRRVILMAAAADATVEFKDAATDTGTVLLTLTTPAKSTLDVDLEFLGGLQFNTGLFVKPAGSGVIAYVWFE